MLVPTSLAAVAAFAPIVAAQVTSSSGTAAPSITQVGGVIAPTDTTSIVTKCTTRFGFYPIPTGSSGTAAVPTWFTYLSKTNVFSITSTTQSTITVTPTASTVVDVITTTTTFTTTETSIPPAVTITPSVGFLPLLAVILPEATATASIGVGNIIRHKRNQVEYSPAMLKRQLGDPTAANNTGGFRVFDNGETTQLIRNNIKRIDCYVTTEVNRTEITIVTGLPVTEVIVPATATDLSTTTVSTTQTVTQVEPTQTCILHAKPTTSVSSNDSLCVGEKLNPATVSHITDFYGNELMFDRVIFSAEAGLPNENELIVNTTNAINCCIQCQNTANCAGSFFVPSEQECHLRLTQKPAPVPTIGNITIGTVGSISNVSLPQYGAVSASGAVGYPAVPYATGTGSAIPSISSGISTIRGLVDPVNSNVTCSKGSLSLYIGTIQGTETFPREYALSFSNGPCGRLTVWPIPVTDNEEDLSKRKLI